MNLGEAIKNARIKAELTPKQVYARANLTQGFYSGIETGMCKPSLDTLQKIADAIGIPMFLIIFSATDKRNLPRKDRAWYDNLAPVMNALIDEITKAK